jgi:hypothetical protein
LGGGELREGVWDGGAMGLNYFADFGLRAVRQSRERDWSRVWEEVVRALENYPEARAAVLGVVG